MKVYVSELPNSCEECPMCRSGKLKLQRKGRYIEAEQCVFGQYKYQTIDDEIDTCPLQSLADYTKQVRKEVVQQIRKYVDNYTKQHTGYYCDPYVNAQDLFELLDQIQGNK